MKQHNLYNKTIKVFFHEDRFHTYTLNEKKGERLLSVTGITGVIDKSRPLMWWSSNMAVDYIQDRILKEFRKLKGTNKEKMDWAQEVMEKARNAYNTESKKQANIGTEIHKWIEEWIKSEDKNIDMPDDQKVINGITAFLKWQKENQAKFLESERLVFSKRYHYCGLLDAVARIGKNLVLMDFKSSKRNKYRKDGLYDEMQIQVAGYQLAYEEETGKQFDKSLVLRFGKEDGEFEATELEDYNKDKKAFLACLKLKKRLKELSKK